VTQQTGGVGRQIDLPSDGRTDDSYLLMRVALRSVNSARFTLFAYITREREREVGELILPSTLVPRVGTRKETKTSSHFAVVPLEVSECGGFGATSLRPCKMVSTPVHLSLGFHVWCLLLATTKNYRNVLYIGTELSSEHS
jgi:hypothetical protein